MLAPTPRPCRSNYYKNCDLYGWNGYTIVDGGWWQSVGVMPNPPPREYLAD